MGFADPAFATMTAHRLSVRSCELRDRIDRVVVVERQADRAPGPPARVGGQGLSLTAAARATDRFEAVQTFAGLRRRRLLQMRPGRSSCWHCIVARFGESSSARAPTNLERQDVACHARAP